jgi:hypothetical protein
MSHLKPAPCLSCLASLWGHLQNNGVAPEVIYDALERQLKLDEEAFEVVKHELPFQDVVEHQMKMFQIYRFLSLLQSIKAHR